MICCNKNDSSKSVPIKLTFHRSELVYDIKNLAYVEGDVLETNDEHQRHQIQDIGEDGNIDRVTRLLDLSFAECLELCHPYSKKEVCEQGGNVCDALRDTDDYVMELNVPVNFSQTTVLLLVRTIHDYMVARVLQDWFSITNVKASSNWQAKLVTYKEGILNAMTAKTGVYERAISTF